MPDRDELNGLMAQFEPDLPACIDRDIFKTKLGDFLDISDHLRQQDPALALRFASLFDYLVIQCETA